MYYHYHYFTHVRPGTVELLEKYHIPYDKIEDLVSFDLYSNVENTEKIMQECLKISPYFKPEFTRAVFEVFELNAANYLWITPTKCCIEINNEENPYHFRCTYRETISKETLSKDGKPVTVLYEVAEKSHISQEEPFKIRKEPKISGKRGFYSDEADCEVFVDHRVRDLVEQSGMTGFCFENVLLNHNVSEKIFQLKSENILDRVCIGTEGIEKIFYCKKCGDVRYYKIDLSYQPRLHIEKPNDLIMTERLFSGGIIRPAPCYIISQRFYQLLKKNKLDGGLRFVPIIEI